MSSAAQQPGGTALVLGGGGVTGIAWEIGVLAGLRAARGPLAAGLDAPALVVGTSAGSVVGTLVAAAADTGPGWDLADALAAQHAPSASEIPRDVDLEALMEAMQTDSADPLEARRHVGEFALGVDRSVADRRRVSVAARLPVHDWPTTPLRITAVDARTGELVVFDGTAGAPLDDAVAASCAVPGVWPTVPVAGRDLMDGGMASLCHATLATGHDRVVVLVPFPAPGGGPVRGLDDELDELRAAGTEVTVIGPDPEYLAGPGSAALDPAGRPAAADLGYRLGRSFGQDPG
ncbi:patatin-like phospholipase family protein [Actinomycetospora termitidis]|uniref:Patatin-like phospholipase family protein n=1 Tax=Actinomycetospora termitidis TaxID=3053470 RepID=A0ABT7M2T7_9PSEU|nr:patatin-like phospholipase family protein [Actinomycetospora sp. Odt1-22]MDL5154347.1 patatin-like phospholipase family protein [Actinomycetospora sp. Odt1-22]